MFWVQVKLDNQWRDEAGFTEYEEAHRHATLDRSLHRFPLRIIQVRINM